jgi:hypothetical protein
LPGAGFNRVRHRPRARHKRGEPLTPHTPGAIPSRPSGTGNSGPEKRQHRTPMTDPASPTTVQTAPYPALMWLALLVIGLGWGATGSFSKLAVSTGNHPIGVTFWNMAIGAVVQTALLLFSGRRLPFDRRHLVFFVTCGFLGTALPNSLF